MYDENSDASRDAAADSLMQKREVTTMSLL